MIRWGGGPRQPLAVLAVGAVLGVLSSEALPGVDGPLWLAMFLLAAGFCLLRPGTVRCWCVAFAGFALLHHLQHFGNEGRQLAELLTEPRALRATGVVVSEPRVPQSWSRNTTCSFQVRLESLELGDGPLASSANLQVRWAGQIPEYGDRVELRGMAKNIPPPRNPGQFDWAAYQRRLHVYSEVNARYPEDCVILSHGHGNPAVSLALHARRTVKGILSTGLEDAPEITNLISSMVLGMRSETPDEIRELFEHTGTLHLFAVSGLNVAMLAFLAAMMLKPLRIRRDLLAALIIPIIAGYALITGLSPSCVRAAIMGGIVLAALLCDRPAVLFNTLGGAALGILAYDTNQLFTAGFQFSFALVIALICMAGRIQKRLEPLGQPDPFLPRPLWSWSVRGRTWAWNQFAAASAVTITAWLGSLFITAAYFHLFSPAALLANLLAVPLAFAVLALGLLATISGPLVPALAVLFNNANWVCCQALMGSIQLCAAIPGGYSYVQVAPSAEQPSCTITVLDVEEGAAIHLRSGAHDWLIDCGHAKPFQHVVLPYLRSQGVDHLEGLVLTHGDAQHIGGAAVALKELTPEKWWDSPAKDRSQTRRKLHQALAEKRIGKRFLRRGDIIAISPEARVEVLYPPASLNRSLADDKALVLRLHAAGLRVLFMSDSGFPTETWLLENEADLRADVVVQGWHSRELSGTSDFLATVRPSLVIAGAPRFGTPEEKTAAWVADLRERGIRALRQDQVGGVTMHLHGGSARISPYLGSAQVVDRRTE